MDTTRYASLVGRLMIGLPFAMSGFGKLAAYGATTAYIAHAGLPYQASWLADNNHEVSGRLSAAAICRTIASPVLGKL